MLTEAYAIAGSPGHLDWMNIWESGTKTLIVSIPKVHPMQINILTSTSQQ